MLYVVYMTDAIKKKTKKNDFQTLKFKQNVYKDRIHGKKSLSRLWAVRPTRTFRILSRFCPKRGSTGDG